LHIPLHVGSCEADLPGERRQARQTPPPDQKTRRRVAAELNVDLEQLDQRKLAANKELNDLVAAPGTGLLDLNGIGPSGA
jgi:hypothetical protein